MAHPDFSVLAFDTRAAAEMRSAPLGRLGFHMQLLKVVGKGHRSEESRTGFQSSGDRSKVWGGVGVFWGGVCGLLLAPAVFMLPGLGLVGMAGPLVTAIVCALEGAVVVGGLAALGAALTQGGNPRISPSNTRQR